MNIPAPPIPRRDEPELLSAAHPSLTREHYLPLGVHELVEALAKTFPPADRPYWQSLARLLAATVHHGLHARQQQLLCDYQPFDPDCDFPRRVALSPEAESAGLDRLFSDFRHLLVQANFVQLDQQDIDEALEAASDWGVRLHVDTSGFERLDVFARGDTTTRRRRCSWKTWYQSTEVEVPIFQRLVVMFRLKEGVTHHPQGADAAHAAPTTTVRPAFVKMFKNVPKMDVDMLLPGCRVKMSLVDRGRILLPTLSGLALAAIKIAKGAVIFTFVSVYGALALVGFVGGTLAYGVKSFFGYLQTKDKYHLHLTRSLYFQNLDNNAGVITRLLYEAEQQELREALLAYAVLRQQPGENGWTAVQLDEYIEAWLHRDMGLLVDFEVDDALQKLLKWDLVEGRGPERYAAVDLCEACRRLDDRWDAWFSPPDREEVRNTE